VHNTMNNDTITVGELSVRFLVEAEDSNGSASVFECHVPADSRMPAPHSHDGFEETIYGLEGTTTWRIDSETVEVLATSAGGPANLAAIGQVMRRHGLTPAPPGYSISTRQEQPR
jgi:hypothetical protein